MQAIMTIINKFLILCFIALRSVEAQLQSEEDGIAQRANLILQRSVEAKWQSGEDGKVQWAKDCDFHLNDIGSTSSKEEDCGGLCIREPQCTRFRWSLYDGGTCQFKTGNGNAIFSETSGSCGYVTVEKFISVKCSVFGSAIFLCRKTLFV